MTICIYCKKEMNDAKTISCDENLKVDFGDCVATPIRYGFEKRNFIKHSERCHDCNIARDGIHHPGCDVEECPKCFGQLISCGCLLE
jgi:hypothetical protein